MAKPGATKRNKVSFASTTKTPSTSSTSTATMTAPPPPFTPAPADMTPFLSTLDKTKVYITHIDRHPITLKKRVFAVPVLLNLTILALLLWRASAIYPTYLDLITNALADQRPQNHTRAQLLGLILRRAATFLLDFVLVRVVWPWPLTFFVLRGNPCVWRWRVGFRAREVVVRVSRGWTAGDLLGARTQGWENPFFKVRVLPAVERGYVRRKTGYLMMGRDWDLDFGAMVRATGFLDAGEVREEGFEKAVWVFCGERVGWAVWSAWRLDEGAEEEGRRKIVAFKERLTALGKESLFFRWVEMVQFESTGPGGLTKEGRERMVRQAKMLFQENGLDFDEVVAGIGGLEGMPGMEGEGEKE